MSVAWLQVLPPSSVLPPPSSLLRPPCINPQECPTIYKEQREGVPGSPESPVGAPIHALTKRGRVRDKHTPQTCRSDPWAGRPFATQNMAGNTRGIREAMRRGGVPPLAARHPPPGEFLEASRSIGTRRSYSVTLFEVTSRHRQIQSQK